MKFKIAVIAILLAILGINAAANIMTVMEAKEQTNIALRTAELISLQADMTAYQTITQVDAAAFAAAESIRPNEKDLKLYITGEQAAKSSNEIQRIRDLLGFEVIQHPVYFFDEESYVPQE